MYNPEIEELCREERERRWRWSWPTATWTASTTMKTGRTRLWKLSVRSISPSTGPTSSLSGHYSHSYKINSLLNMFFLLKFVPLFLYISVKIILCNEIWNLYSTLLSRYTSVLIAYQGSPFLFILSCDKGQYCLLAWNRIIYLVFKKLSTYIYISLRTIYNIMRKARVEL